MVTIVVVVLILAFSTFAAKAADWILKWSEQQPTRDTAMQREKQIKQKKSRKYIQWLISSVE